MSREEHEETLNPKKIKHREHRNTPKRQIKNSVSSVTLPVLSKLNEDRWQKIFNRQSSIFNFQFSIINIQFLASCFLLLFLSFSLYSIEIYGKIVNEQNLPLENVIISTENKTVISNRSGFFDLDQVQENEKIKIHKIGFEDMEFIADEIPQKIILKKKAIEISGIEVVEERFKQVLTETSDKIIIKVEKKSENNAADILKDIPGIYVQGVDLPGERKTVSLLGHKSKHTLIMLDGIPLNPSGQDFDLSTIPAEIIDNIEIIRNNPQSGSGSMAGIININTKKSNGRFSLKTGQKIGSFGLSKTYANLSISNRYFYSYLYAAHNSTNNDFLFNNESGSENNLKNNDNSIQDLDFSIGLNSFPLEIEYGFDVQKFSRKYLTPENINIYDNSKLEGLTNRHKIHLKKDFSKVNITSNLFYFYDRSTYDNMESSWFPILNHHFRNSRGIDTKISFKEKIINFDLGTSYKYEDFESENETNPSANIAQKYRENYAGFGNVKFSKYFFPFSSNLLLSSRIEKYNNFGKFATYRFDADFKYENFLTFILGGSFGTGFTVPSFYDLYWNDGQAHGNEDLVSESSKGGQIFGKLEWLKNSLKISFHSNTIKNLIHWTRQTDYWRPENIETVNISNFEIDSHFSFFKHFNLGISYLKTFAKNKTKDGDLYNKFLPYIPEYNFQAILKYEIKKFSTKIIHSKTGKQYTTPDQLSEELIMPEFDLTNIEVSYNIQIKKMNFGISGAVNNIFDENYELYKYMPQPGRNWQIEMNVKYKI